MTIDKEVKEALIRQVKMIGKRIEKIVDDPGTGDAVLNLTNAQVALILQLKSI